MTLVTARRREHVAAMPKKKAVMTQQALPRERGATTPKQGSFTEPYKAYAVAAGGARALIDADSIVVDVGGKEIEVSLRVPQSQRGRLRVAARDGGVDGLLVIGPGDGGSVYVAVEPFGGARLRKP